MPMIDAYGASHSESGSQGQSSIAFFTSGHTAAPVSAFSRAALTYGLFGFSETSSPAYGHLLMPVQVVSVEVVHSKRIRVSFDRPMCKDEALANAANYQIAPADDSGEPLYYRNVEVPNTTNPEYVEIIVSEMTGSTSYNCTVNHLEDGPVDLEGVHFESGNETMFVGVGVAPELVYARSIDKTTIELVFSEGIKDTDGASDVGVYSFDKDLSVVGVVSVLGAVVTLTTSEQIPNELYTLTIGA